MGHREFVSKPDTPLEQVQKNPNSIGEIINISKDLPTSPDKVYRSVRGREAIDDLYDSGVVRNRQSAGLGESRWGEKVFWSRGGEGKYHVVPEGSYVIEAPFSVAQERVVRREDVTGIYTRSESGEVVDLLKRQRQELARQSAEKSELTLQRKSQEEQRITDLKRDLGMI